MTTSPTWPHTFGQRILFCILLIFVWAGGTITLHLLLKPVLGNVASRVVIFILGVVLVVGYGLHKLGNHTLEQTGWTTARWKAEALRGGLGALAIVGLVLSYTAVLAGPEDAWAMVQAIAGYSWLQRLGFLATGISAATLEESVWRGYLQPAMIGKLGFIGGVGGTALLFAFAHGSFAGLRLLSIFTIGLVYGLLRGRDRSLTAPFVAHVLTWAIMGDA